MKRDTHNASAAAVLPRAADKATLAASLDAASLLALVGSDDESIVGGRQGHDLGQGGREQEACHQADVDGHELHDA